MPAKRASPRTGSHRVFGQGAGRRKTSFRAGLYARVSTHDQQTLPMQNRALREYAARRGWSVVMQVKEVAPARHNAKLASNCWTPHVAERSTPCWCGDWTAGAGRSPTCSPRYKNWNTWASVSSR